MNCAAEIETNRNALRRIMALLFALADLAECAAGRSWPVRRLALSILGFAEEVAHAFVTGSASAPSFNSSRGDGPLDAMQLALSFRMLALAVHAMLGSRFRGRARRDAGRIDAGARAGRNWPLAAHLPQRRQAAASPGPAFRKWPDTS